MTALMDQAVGRYHYVTVDGVDYAVASEADRSSFRAVLRSCGEFRAARRLSRWAAKRGAPFSGAGAEKRAMVAALLTPEPRRKRRGQGP